MRNLHHAAAYFLVKGRGMSESEAEEAVRFAAGKPAMRELLISCRQRIVGYVRNSANFVLFFTRIWEMPPQRFSPRRNSNLWPSG